MRNCARGAGTQNLRSLSLQKASAPSVKLTVSDPDIRAMVLEGFSELDKAFASCFRLAREKGELAPSANPVVLAQLASATIHTIAIRARAGVPRKELEAIVNGAIDVMCRA